MHHEPSEDFAAAVAAGTESPEVGLRFATAVAAQMRYCDSVADAAPVAADSLLCTAAARALILRWTTMSCGGTQRCAMFRSPDSFD